MAISLAKGQSIVVPQEEGSPFPDNVWVGLGWDPAPSGQPARDLDIQAFMLGSDEQVVSEEYFVYYGEGHNEDPTKSLKLTLDSREGNDAGLDLGLDSDPDDERIEIKFATVPAEVQSIVITVSIHEAEKRGQHFGTVENACVRLVNFDHGDDIAEFYLTEDAANATCVYFCKFVRTGKRWDFHALGEPAQGDLASVVQGYGIVVSNS